MSTHKTSPTCRQTNARLNHFGLVSVSGEMPTLYCQIDLALDQFQVIDDLAGTWS